MSKTTNYQLTLWDYADEGFGPKKVREDLAENFTKLDTALKAEETTRVAAITAEINARKSALTTGLGKKTAIICGTYTGTGTPSTNAYHINLGCKPLAVHIEKKSGSRNGNVSYGGLAIRDNPLNTAGVIIDETGFKVAYSNSCDLNKEGAVFFFVAHVEVLPG